MVVNPAQSRVGLTFNFEILPLQKGQVLAQKKCRQLTEDEDIPASKKSPPSRHPAWLDPYLSIIISLVRAKSEALQFHQPLFKSHCS